MLRLSIATAMLAATAVLVTTWPSPAEELSSADMERSPLADYLGFGHHPAQEEKLYDAEETRRQAIIEGCMREAGFDYWPRPVELDLTTANQPDPNRDYRNALPSQSAKDYSIALSGRSESEGLDAEEMDQRDVNKDGRLDFDERASLGCLGRAEAAVPGVFHVVGLLRDELARMNESVHESPEQRAAEAEYIACMHVIGVLGDSRESVQKRTLTQYFDPDAAGSIPPTAAVEACEQGYQQSLAAVLLEAETTFATQNRSMLESSAVPAS